MRMMLRFLAWETGWRVVMPFTRKEKNSRYEERLEQRMDSVLDMLNLEYP